MLIIGFIILITIIMVRKGLEWFKIDKNIDSSQKWSIAEGHLHDFQSIEVDTKGFKKLRNNQEYVGYATFMLDGKTIGCQRISFYPKTHIINSDYGNEIPEDRKVKIWYDKENPVDSVLLSPEMHERNLLTAKAVAFQLVCASMITLALLI